MCAFCVGIAKTGVPGFGTLIVPMMVLTVGDARASAAWLLPILSTADVFAVVYWRRHAAARRLFTLAPWVLAGMAGGAAALTLSERAIRTAVAIIIFSMLALYLWRKARKALDTAPHPALYGTTAGFATTVANAAGPVMNLYLLSRRLPKEEFIATGAWFFFLINLMKVPIYWWHGLFSRESLAFDLIMVPAVCLGAISGRKLVDLIPARVFEAIVTLLTAISTLYLVR